MSEHPISKADRLVRDGTHYRYRIDFQYDGTEFSGMQWQPDRRSVQQCLEDALDPLFGHSVRVIPSSRTDAGVHAAHQVAHVDVEVVRPPHSIVRAGNSFLPPDVRITGAEQVDEDFHARFSAKWRGYAYRVSLVPMAIGRQYRWQYLQPLDVAMLNAEATAILGTNNFEAFAHENETEKHGYGCTVFRSEWEIQDDVLIYHIAASRFVHGMVRMLVGTMVDIAGNRGSASSLANVLASHDNRNAGTKAPACGLTLETVGYREWPEK